MWSGINLWCGLLWCAGPGVWSVGAYKGRFSVYKYRCPQFWNLTVIQKSAYKIDIFSIDSGFFDARLEIFTPAPQVVQVKNIR